MEEKQIANSSLGQTPPPRQRLEFAYDSQSRRVRKVVKVLQGQTWSVTSDLRFAYDAWNMIAEFSLQNSTLILQRSYAWGYDLSGTEQGAGGVGGLVLVKSRDAGSTTVNNGQPPSTSVAPCYDGNGNILAYLDCVSGAVTQRMEYDAFGNEMTLDSVLAGNTASSREVPFRFSTKYADSETGLSYYGYRYYSAELGRWPNRDPIAEKGGVNVYGMVGNDVVNRGDNLGLSEGLQELELGDDVTGDKAYTYVEACNVVVFFGHNGLVPQHEIFNHPASAATNVSCGPVGERIVPGRPQPPIPNVTAYNINPYTGPGSVGDVKMAQGKAWASKAYTQGLAHARNTLCKSTHCCSKITVRVECRFRLLETEPQECALREVVDCALEK